MASMLRLCHFDITADDPKRAMKLYMDILMWKSGEWNDPMPYRMVTTGKNEGING